MNDPNAISTEVLSELATLRRRVRELESAAARGGGAEEALEGGEGRFRAPAEAALTQSVSRLRATLEATADGILVVDLEGRIQDFNERFLQMWHLPGDLLPAGRTRDLLVSDTDQRAMEFVLDQLVDKEAFLAKVGELYTQPEAASFDVMEFKDGRVFERYSLPQRVEGRPVGRVWSFRDATEQRRVEQALREEFSFREAIIECAAEGLCVCHEIAEHPHVNFTVWNPRMVEITGYTLVEINRLGWYQTLYPEPELQARARERMARMRLGENLKSEEWSITRADGTRRLVSISTSIVRREVGEVNVLALMQDMTERKQAEEGRRVMEAQMQQAQKLESLGILAGGIAHDFNNLLMAILGHADLALAEMPAEAPAREDVREIEHAAHRAAELCRQMLAYAGKGRFAVEPLDLSRLVHEMTHLLQVSISKKALLRGQFAEGLPAMEADPSQVRQVVMNLVINASEAIGDNEGVIAINTGVLACDGAALRSSQMAEVPAAGTYVYVEVADTGCGMDAETRARIFDPFFTTKFTGRGLGLAAVLGIMRTHKGAVQVDSEPGRGTTFRVLFPVSCRTVPESVAGAAVELWQGSGTILVVDDEESVREVAVAFVERSGLRALMASDGREAVRLFQEHASEIGCVVLDLTMPHMDGEETYRELRRIRPDVRVLLASGYSEEEINRRFAGQQLAGFIEKPYQMSTLNAKLREVLTRVEGQP